MSPRSREWVWGVDVATLHLDFGFREVGGEDPTRPWRRWNSMVIPPEKDLGIRLLALEHEVGQFVPALAGHFPPIAVVVELPSGKFTSPPLYAAWAVTTMALRAVLPGVLIAADITPTIWKKGVGLPGNAKKPQIMALARELGYTGTGQDCADATCIAEYGALQLLPQLSAAA